MNTKQKIGRACMIVGILLILGALALLGYNQWDANRADKASQDALGKLEETLTETMEDKTKDEEPVVQPELDPEQEMTVTDIDGWGYIGYLSIPRNVISIGLITAAALIPAKPVPSPAPIPAKNVTRIVNNTFILLYLSFVPDNR